VDVKEDFILLVHQGMIEDIFINDLKDRGVEVTRNSPFLRYSLQSHSNAPLEVVCNDNVHQSEKRLKAKYLVGCDGARSMVRKSIPGAEMAGESSRAPWGVLDGKQKPRYINNDSSNAATGVVETDFPDLWSKTVVHSEEKGTILCIPRERNMVRLYIELNPGMHEVLSSESSSQEFVIKRAQDILAPFTFTWKSIGMCHEYQVPSVSNLAAN
jgi:phenol 2-monooxygenase